MSALSWVVAIAGVLAAAGTHVDGSARGAVVSLVVASVAHAALSIRRDALGRRHANVLMMGAAAAAVVWWAAPPVLSDDVFRYLLDGRTGWNGVNPYAYAPSSPKIGEWVAQLPGAVNHPALPTIYPPIAQALFLVPAALGGGVAVWKALCVAAVVAGTLGWHCADRERDASGMSTALWVASHPLVGAVAAGSGNIDAFALPIVALAIVVAAGRKPGWLGLAIGAAAGVKAFPIALLAAVRGRLWTVGAAAAVAGIVLMSSYAPVAAIGPKALGSAGRYAESWEFNAGAFALARGGIVWAAERAGVPPNVALGERGRTAYFDGEPDARAWHSRDALAGKAARLLGGLAWLVAAGVAFRKRWSFARSAALGLGVLFACSPVVHPWYLLWLLPLAMEARCRAGLVWCGTVGLAFWAPAVVADGAGPWHDPLWVRAIEYGAVAIALAVGAWDRRRAQSAAQQAFAGV